MRFTIFSGTRNNRCRRLRLLGTALLMVFGTVSGAFAEDPVKFKSKLQPGLLTAHGDWTVSADYFLGVEAKLLTQPSEQSFRKRLNAFINTKGTVAVDPDLNSKPLTAAAGLTTSISLRRPYLKELGQKPGEFITKQEGFDYGMATFGLQGGYETDQRFDNRNYTGGIELGYVLNEHDGYKALIPSAWIGFDEVVVDHSKQQQAIGGPDESQRLRVFGSWKLPVGGWLAKSLDPLDFHLDVRYFLTTDAPVSVRAADKDDALYLAQALSYSFREPLWGFVNEVRLQVTEGRIPPATEDRTSVTIGLTVWER